MEINGTEIQLTYAVCFDPLGTFNPWKFVIEAEFDTYREAKKHIEGSTGKRVYVEAAIVRSDGDLESCYWGRNKQQAIHRLKEGEKL